MTEKNNNITVLGGGSFGTAIANMIAANGAHTTLWMRDEENVQRCRRHHENDRYLPGYKLDKRLHITSDLAVALHGAKLVFFSVPSKAFRDVCRHAADFIEPGTMAVSTAKGIEGDTFRLMSSVLTEELDQPRVGVISGPNLAREVARQELTATVIASADEGLCSTVQKILGTTFFRVYANHDMFGVELAGALKNIYAIAAGIASAMDLGQNTMSMLITRSLAEMTRFATRLGADPMTFIGLSGVGDLFVTCTSPLSRNYRIGQALGRGKSLEEAIEEVGQVAEGVNTTRTVKLKADELDIYMPLVTGLYEVMFNGASISDVIKTMMVSTQTEDVEFRVQ
ncbi:MAG: NAD(P)H-dependent glycerol-3-phosphate dehydrogenase [Gammaproteobacteria bacterium]|nr:MAG: NAD(P)H-dependent glycerol-3-phosphate dehydrogenase [Gammaproteobacteria bacterium]RLA53921.1 MAG: NAD(P)H-dependent glycerol-3-phosphate dehydrogenase [Gammaproteobacteria bacterium]